MLEDELECVAWKLECSKEVFVVVKEAVKLLMMSGEEREPSRRRGLLYLLRVSFRPGEDEPDDPRCEYGDSRRVSSKERIEDVSTMVSAMCQDQHPTDDN